MNERPFGLDKKHCISKRNERKDAVESRLRILETAQKLFKECGVEAVSMHQIAKSARVGQGTLYRRYAHKGELCLDLLTESAEEFMQQTECLLAAAEAKTNDLDVLENIIVRIIDFTDAKAHLLAAMNNSKLVGTNAFYRQLHAIVSMLLERISERNQLTPLNVTLTADILLSAVSPELYMFERETRGYSKEQFIAGIRRMYFSGIFDARPQQP